MGDLISRKALVAALIREREQYPPMVAERYSFGVKLPHRFNQAMRGGIRKALRLIETAPAFEIVLCKDCKHRGIPGDCPMSYSECTTDEDGYSDYYDVDQTDDCGFCHKGEMMRGDTDAVD